MRIIIFEDEKDFAQSLSTLIKEYLHKREFYDFTIEIMIGNISIYNFKPTTNDLIFLDIATPENENFGIEAAKYIRNQNSEAHIIFITSHYEKIRDVLTGLIRPSEFIVKPIKNIEKEKLFLAIDTFIERLSKGYISFKVGGVLYKISLSEVLYLHKEERKTVISTNSQHHMIRQSFHSTCEMLDNRFMVVDKGMTVNLNEVCAYNPKRRFLYLKNGKEIYVSRNKARALKQYLIGWEVKD